MSQAVSNPLPTEVTLARLDELIATLKKKNPEQAGLLLEHLQSARAYWLGAMPKEYAGALQNALDVASHVKAEELRRTLQGMIDYLLTELPDVYPPDSSAQRHHPHPKQHSPPPPGVRSPLWNFFSASDTSFGVFYPSKHIVATFPSFELAKQAEEALRGIGFEEREALAIQGDEMLQFLNELRDHAGLWGILMARLSRIFGTEEVFVDSDLRRARAGDAFLAIYSPEDAETKRIHQLLAPFGPVAMERYLASGISELV